MLNVVDEQTTETDEMDSLSDAGGVNCEVRDESEKLQFKLAPCFSQKIPVGPAQLSNEQPAGEAPALGRENNTLGSNLQNYLFDHGSQTVRISMRKSITEKAFSRGQTGYTSPARIVGNADQQLCDVKRGSSLDSADQLADVEEHENYPKRSNSLVLPATQRSSNIAASASLHAGTDEQQECYQEVMDDIASEKLPMAARQTPQVTLYQPFLSLQRNAQTALIVKSRRSSNHRAGSPVQRLLRQEQLP